MCTRSAEDSRERPDRAGTRRRDPWTTTTATRRTGVGAAIWSLFMIAFYVLVVIGLWKTFVKAGHPGWAAIIPFYNHVHLGARSPAGRPRGSGSCSSGALLGVDPDHRLAADHRHLGACRCSSRSTWPRTSARARASASCSGCSRGSCTWCSASGTTEYRQVADVGTGLRAADGSADALRRRRRTAVRSTDSGRRRTAAAARAATPAAAARTAALPGRAAYRRRRRRPPAPTPPPAEAAPAADAAGRRRSSRASTGRAGAAGEPHSSAAASGDLTARARSRRVHERAGEAKQPPRPVSRGRPPAPHARAPRAPHGAGRPRRFRRTPAGHSPP